MESVKETSQNQIRMPNYPSVPSQKIIDAIFLKLYHLLQITKFCSILQQPHHFMKKPGLIQFRMPNYPCIPALEEIDTQFLKLYYLLQIMIICSILQQPDDFCKRNHSESIQNTQLPQYTKFGNNQCVAIRIMPFVIFSGFIFEKIAAAAAAAAAAKQF